MRTRIKRVTVEAFRGFADRQTTPVLPATGLVGIRGHNIDTGGSSGAGKSSIAYAICFAFGLLKPPYTAERLQSNKTKTKMQVEVELESDEGAVVLKRGKITSIKVGDEREITGSINEVDKRLYKLIGLTPDMLRALTFRQQKKPGLFLAMKDVQKKEFFSQLLGLEEVEKQIDLAVPRSNQLKSEVELLEKMMFELGAQIRPLAPLVLLNAESASDQLAITRKQYDEQRALLGALNAEFTKASADAQLAVVAKQQDNEKRLVEFKEAQKLLRANRSPRPLATESEISKQLRTALETTTQRIVTEEAERRRVGGLAQKAAKDAADILIKTQRVVESGDKHRSDLARVRSDIEKAEESICPTCSQEWFEAQDKLETWKKREKELLEALEGVEKAAAAYPRLRVEVDTAQRAVDAVAADPTIDKLRALQADIQGRIASEIANNEVEARTYDAKVAAEEQRLKADVSVFAAELETEKNALVAAVMTPLSELNSKIQGVNLSVNMTRQEFTNAEYEVRTIATKNELEVARYERDSEYFEVQSAKLTQLREDIQGKTTEYKSEADFAASLKTFLGSIFDEILSEVATEANELLLALPNVATTTISFESDKISEKGVVRKEIRPVLKAGGEEVDLEVYLSGGQGTSVELAVDLAIGRVIGRRTGNRPGWLILDESFEGHDVVVKEACLEVLQKAARDCTILIVDHASELKEMFSAFIDVESTNEVSRIVEVVP